MLLRWRVFLWYPQNLCLNICIRICRFQSAWFPRKLFQLGWLLHCIVGYNWSLLLCNLSGLTQWFDRCSLKGGRVRVFTVSWRDDPHQWHHILYFQKPIQHKAEMFFPRLSSLHSICFGKTCKSRKGLRQLQQPTQHILVGSTLVVQQYRCRPPGSNRYQFPGCNLKFLVVLIWNYYKI